MTPTAPHLGEGKHPGALGKKGKDVWPENWDQIKPRIDNIKEGVETTWHKNERLPIYGNDKIEGAFRTYSYSGISDETENIAGVLAACYETTQAVLAEKELLNACKEKNQDTEEKLRDIVEHSTNLFYTHTPDHVVTYISPQTEGFFGYKAEEAMMRWTDIATDNPVNATGIEITERAIRTGEPQPPYELEIRKKNGETIWVEVNEAPVVKEGKTVAMVGSLTDITERKKARQEITESLKEKEILLSEIHHRVKNNLAVVSGLMLLQSAEEENQTVVHTLHDSISRIKTIANIHEHLYKSDSFSKLEFDENIKTVHWAST